MTDGVALVKESLRLSDLVRRYVKELKKRGSRLAACCPFHDEKTPSFYMDDEKGLFHCFSCKKGGDLIQFARDMEGLSFPEALDFLADIAGIELPKMQGRGPSREIVETLRALNGEAADFYHRQLKKNQEALKYLRDRGIKESTINLFKLGYAPGDWEGLLRVLQKKYDPAILAICGLFKHSKRNTLYDIFRNRIVFPILDCYGHVVAFGARTFCGEGGPKYMNSPETPLYVKGKHLYNLHFAKAFLYKESKNPKETETLKKSSAVIVVEGYMDVIQVYQAGVGHVIAALGTAFTPAQAKLLKRFADKAILNFDADAAGFKAARTTIETLLEQDLDIGVVSLPDKADPDDFIKQHGIGRYREEVERASDFLDFLLDYFMEGKEQPLNPRELSLVVQEVGQTLSFVPDEIIRYRLVEQVSSLLHIKYEIVVQAVKKQVEARAAAQHKLKAKLKPVKQQPLEPNDLGMIEADADAGIPEADVEVGFDRGMGQEGVPQQGKDRVGVPFGRLERIFLYYIMHSANFEESFLEEHRPALPQLLEYFFWPRAWVPSFVSHQTEDLQERLDACAPKEIWPEMREIYFDVEIEKKTVASDNPLELLFPDLLIQMLKQIIRMNKGRRAGLTTDQRKALMAQNRDLGREILKLEASRWQVSGARTR